MQGSLRKRGQVVHTWRSRYFTLEGTNLRYWPTLFSHEQGAKPRGQLRVLAIMPWSDAWGTEDECGLVVQADNGRLLHVRAATKESASEWRAALHASIVGAGGKRGEERSRRVVDKLRRDGAFHPLDRVVADGEGAAVSPQLVEQLADYAVGDTAIDIARLGGETELDLDDDSGDEAADEAREVRVGWLWSRGFSSQWSRGYYRLFKVSGWW